MVQQNEMTPWRSANQPLPLLKSLCKLRNVRIVICRNQHNIRPDESTGMPRSRLQVCLQHRMAVQVLLIVEPGNKSLFQIEGRQMPSCGFKKCVFYNRLRGSQLRESCYELIGKEMTILCTG